MSDRYYNVGDFIKGKKNGEFFRITGLLMSKDGSIQYSIIKINFDSNVSKVIDAQEINNFDKM